jgi:tetratricopeptide (TPR) repeat protein
MSDPNVKGAKRSPARSASSAASAKNRASASKRVQQPKPLVKRSSTEKAPARKAAKPKLASSKKSKTTKPVPKSAAQRKTVTSKTVTAAQGKKAAAPARPSKNARALEVKKPTTQAKPSLPPANKRKQPAPTVVRSQPTPGEAAALRAFERAHKEFARGRFAEARTLFRQLVEQYAGASEVTARARTYLAIAETRLRAETTLPRDADSLYDRGVIELNRGDFVAAQEFFERALKREPEAAHIHYGLAATRARLGSINSALESLRQALNFQPQLRLRAQHDQDLAVLRSDADFEELLLAAR